MSTINMKAAGKQQNRKNNESANNVNNKRKEKNFKAKGVVTDEGTVIVMPTKDLFLDETMPKLFDQWEECTQWDDGREMPCISVTGLCHLYPDGSSAFRLYSPEMDRRITELAAQEHKPRLHSKVATRTLRARTGCGVVREGEHDLTLYVRVPKELLEALQVSFETYAQNEVQKLMVQCAMGKV